MSSTQTTPHQILAIVASEMVEVDRVIQEKLSTGVPLVAQMCDYIISAGGKRLRPALTLLMGQALGQGGPVLHQLAAVVEFIHTATLLHDDVVDESTLRRGRETANQRFGNAASVLVGDFLYSRAFQMMVEVGQMRVMDILSDATNVIAEGEVLQLLNMGDATLDETGYLHVIRSKTAKLFEASARLPAVIANSSTSTEHACAAYGQALGTAFQIVDDILDYDGDASVLGKNLGDDLREGKVTLPLIHALKLTKGPQHRVLVNAIESESCDDLGQVIDLIRSTGAIAAARETANQEAQRAISAAMSLPESVARSALIHLAASLQERSQ